jgi:putative membrane protein
MESDAAPHGADRVWFVVLTTVAPGAERMIATAMPVMGAMPLVRFNVHTALTKWSFGPFALCVLAACIAVAIWYLRAEWQLAARGRRWPIGRRIYFFIGLIAFDFAFQSPIAILAGSYFQAHVIQHLLLMVVAPPLLALGAPSTLMLQTSSRRLKSQWLRVLRSSPFAVLSHPIVVWFLYYGAMFVFFLTPLINVAMWHMDLMDLINMVFFFGATLFWWPMVGLDPIVHWKMTYPFRMLNILLGTGLEAFLGVAIINNVHPVASMYTLGSTHAGGALLWTSTELVTVGAFLPIYIQWSRSETRVGARADRLATARAAAEDAGVVEDLDAPPRELTPWEAEWFARTGMVPGVQRGDPSPSG